MKTIQTRITALLAAALLALSAGCGAQTGGAFGGEAGATTGTAPTSAATAAATDGASSDTTTDTTTGETAMTPNTTAAQTARPPATTNPPAATTTTTRTTSAAIPAAKQVGSASFKPGTKFKGSTLNYRSDGEALTLGVWWWKLSGILEPQDGVDVDMALDMLIANKVTEVYLDVGKMVPWEEEEAQGGLTEDDLAAGLVSELYVRGFVKKCNQYGIRVAALAGAGSDSVLRWIDPQYNHNYMKNFVSKIRDYNANAKTDERFYAVHLDVEPHTMNNWSSNRAKYIQWLADMVVAARKECDAAGVQLEHDIVFWFEETDMVKDASGKEVNILELMTKQCHSLGIMSYYNSGAGQFDRATNLELAYAKKNGCRLIAGTETVQINPQTTSYYSSTTAKFIQEQGVLSGMLRDCGYSKVGGAIHHVYSLYAILTK